VQELEWPPSASPAIHQVVAVTGAAQRGGEVLHVVADAAAQVLGEPAGQRGKVQRIPRRPRVVIAGQEPTGRGFIRGNQHANTLYLQRWLLSSGIVCQARFPPPALPRPWRITSQQPFAGSCLGCRMDPASQNLPAHEPVAANSSTARCRIRRQAIQPNMFTRRRQGLTGR
jgi:hypothetical protein